MTIAGVILYIVGAFITAVLTAVADREEHAPTSEDPMIYGLTAFLWPLVALGALANYAASKVEK